MVYRKSLVLYAYLYATAHRQLVGVDLGRQKVLRCLQDAVRVFYCKKAFVAKDVHKVGIFCRLGNKADDHVHIVLVRVAPSHGVGSQEGTLHGGRDAPFDAVNDPQHLHLALGAQAVAALDLKGYGAFVHHFLHAHHGLAEELVLGGLVQKVRRVEDSAAPRRYLLIGQAVDLVQKLAVAAPGIDQVRVAVAEARHDHAALGVDRFFASLRMTGSRSEVGDAAVIDGNPGVFQHACAALCGAFHPKDALRLDAREEAYVIDKIHSG